VGCRLQGVSWKQATARANAGVPPLRATRCGRDDEQNKHRQRQMRGSFDSLRSLRMTSVNRQRQEQMRGFFPFTTLRVRMTNKNRMTSVNRQRQEPMRGFFDSLRSLRMTSVNRQRQMRGFFRCALRAAVGMTNKTSTGNGKCGGPPLRSGLWIIGCTIPLMR
jgi:hypothetical protein